MCAANEVLSSNKQGFACKWINEEKNNFALQEKVISTRVMLFLLCLNCRVLLYSLTLLLIIISIMRKVKCDVKGRNIIHYHTYITVPMEVEL